MKVALNMIREELKLCDVIIYVLDARCPVSSLNPKFEEFTARKPVLFVLNKIDLAKSGVRNNLSILANKDGSNIVLLNSTQSGAGQKIINGIDRVLVDKINAMKEKGIKKIVRAAVIGVPNCGKSTLINNLAGKGKTLTGDRPGVTRTKQWVVVNDHLWILDTPGTLYPWSTTKGGDEERLKQSKIAKNLAYVGSIKDDIMDIIELAKNLVADLNILDQNCLNKRFGADSFEDICKKRGYVLKGGVLDEGRGAKAILTEFRAGKIGNFNLDELVMV